MTTHHRRHVAATAPLLLMLACAPASAHTGSMTGGFVGGFAHPLFGPEDRRLGKTPLDPEFVDVRTLKTIRCPSQ